MLGAKALQYSEVITDSVLLRMSERLGISTFSFIMMLTLTIPVHRIGHSRDLHKQTPKRVLSSFTIPNSEFQQFDKFHSYVTLIILLLGTVGNMFCKRIFLGAHKQVERTNIRLHMSREMKTISFLRSTFQLE